MTLTEKQLNAKTVDARGCTGLTELAAPNAKTVDARGCTGLTELAAPNAEYVDARGCTGLTELAAPNAEYVDARGCTGLTELAAPNAKTVDASGCTGLTELAAPNAKYVYARGCTGLAEKFQESGEMVAYLTGGGKTLEEVCAPEHWNCHDWSNCPTAAAYNGANCISQLPAVQQMRGALFISLFDSGLLKNPLDQNLTKE